MTKNKANTKYIPLVLTLGLTACAAQQIPQQNDDNSSTVAFYNSKDKNENLRLATYIGAGSNSLLLLDGNSDERISGEEKFCLVDHLLPKKLCLSESFLREKYPQYLPILDQVNSLYSRVIDSPKGNFRKEVNNLGGETFHILFQITLQEAWDEGYGR